MERDIEIYWSCAKTGRRNVDRKKNRLSRVGRLKCAAAGRRNVRRALETSHAAIPALRAACSGFDACLDAEIGAEPSATKQGLRLAASASFAALYIVREKLPSARTFRRIESLVAELTPLQGALSRSLRALGVAPPRRLARLRASREAGSRTTCARAPSGSRRKPMPDIPDFETFCDDPQLLGEPISPAWVTFYRAVEGLPLDEEGEELFCRCTGKASRRAVLILNSEVEVCFKGI